MPTVAYVCESYGWTLDQVLDLPIKTIFAFAREARRNEAARSMNLLRIHASTAGIKGEEYYKQQYEHFSSIVFPEGNKIGQRFSDLQKKEPGPALSLSNENDKNLIRDFFGYGRGFYNRGRAVPVNGRQ